MIRNSCHKIEAKIFQYTNSSRKQRGLSPVKYSKNLQFYAQRHSNEMADNKYLYHGNNVEITGASENCGMMYKGHVKGVKYEIRTDADIARALHGMWMRSKAGHRENILDPRHKYVGIGVKRSGNAFYATELFHH